MRTVRPMLLRCDRYSFASVNWIDVALSQGEPVITDDASTVFEISNADEETYVVHA